MKQVLLLPPVTLPYLRSAAPPETKECISVNRLPGLVACRLASSTIGSKRSKTYVGAGTTDIHHRHRIATSGAAEGERVLRNTNASLTLASRKTLRMF